MSRALDGLIASMGEDQDLYFQMVEEKHKREPAKRLIELSKADQDYIDACREYKERLERESFYN